MKAVIRITLVLCLAIGVVSGSGKPNILFILIETNKGHYVHC
jgi:hypothetical protein